MPYIMHEAVIPIQAPCTEAVYINPTYSITLSSKAYSSSGGQLQISVLSP
jgi:hypothetical protein